jgi:AAA+ superfamily predicted ATPase
MQIDDLPSYTMVAAATNHPELLDRAAWRRFQVRINLPLPNQKELTCFIEGFLSKLQEPYSQSPQTIAKTLGRISYAEAEQFCLDVRRQQVLSIGNKTLKTIVAEQLKIWTSEFRAKRPSEAAE